MDDHRRSIRCYSFAALGFNLFVWIHSLVLGARGVVSLMLPSIVSGDQKRYNTEMRVLV